MTVFSILPLSYIKTKPNKPFDCIYGQRAPAYWENVSATLMPVFLKETYVLQRRFQSWYFDAFVFVLFCVCCSRIIEIRVFPELNIYVCYYSIKLSCYLLNQAQWHQSDVYWHFEYVLD